MLDNVSAFQGDKKREREVVACLARTSSKLDGRGSGFARRACYLGTADKAEAVFNGAARAVPRS